MDLERDFDDIELPTLHERTYLVRSFRQGPATMRLRGVVHDQKPAGMYIPDDPLPMTVHHMVVDLTIEYERSQMTLTSGRTISLSELLATLRFAF